MSRRLQGFTTTAQVVAHTPLQLTVRMAWASARLRSRGVARVHVKLTTTTAGAELVVETVDLCGVPDAVARAKLGPRSTERALSADARPLIAVLRDTGQLCLPGSTVGVVIDDLPRAIRQARPHWAEAVRRYTAACALMGTPIR